MNDFQRKVIFIVGPTASGKSELAVALARKLGGEVISADSMLVYKGMDIGTAKLSRAARGGVPHHGIDLISPDKNFSVFAYRRYALKTIAEVRKRRKIPIVAGGTGFYIRALLEGLSPRPGANLSIRRKLEAEALQKGLPALYERLFKVDPDRARAIGPYNQRRIIRALEIYELSGQRPSQEQEKSPGLQALGYEPVVIGLHRDRQALYEKIDRRVDRMFRKGLVREVKRLMRGRISQTALQGVGYKEVVNLLEPQGRQKPPAAAIKDVKAKIQQATRHFAKRQWTWFKREKGIRWVWWPEGVPVSKVVHCILNMTRDKK
ncbi:MAG: tRNA (adenosine(37)-N6)-dimethylallyltransferase MiaA [Candidatus Omnitrophica bacterium]|nr:tRNA (adenosine(37)-N6)-dimethylallyltransferase MiaA [Candidatus Omnitrophota bacterium]